MGIKDFFVTPIYIVLFTIVAYFIRPYLTNEKTRQYFLPAMWTRFFGALSLGLVYQHYYGGGDTFNYWQHGSQWIWKAFMDNPTLGIRILLSESGDYSGGAFPYVSQIWYFNDPKSFLIVRVAALFDIFTFGTYSATALFFSLYSFSGLWAMYSILERNIGNTRWMAFAILFVPSTVFWGSGILKDSITLGALGWLIWSLYNMIEVRSQKIGGWLMALLSIILIVKIKVYILISLVPAMIVWLYLKNLAMIRRKYVRLLIAPLLLVILVYTGFQAVDMATRDTLYSLDSIAERAAITAYDIRYGWGARTGETSGYDLGVMDGSWQSMIRLMPAAINVSLFRPYLWEVKNPLMLISAIESLMILFLTIWALSKKGNYKRFGQPFMLFCLLFSLVFAFAVGVSTYNFGTLIRYKIPLVPMYLVPLLTYSKRN